MTAETALTTYEQPSGPVRIDFAGGMARMGRLGEEDFNAHLDQLKKGQERLVRLHQSLMVENADYGVIPNTNKPTLLKSGAEKLGQFYNLVPRFHHQVENPRVGDIVHVAVVVTCDLHLGSSDGPIVGQGGGACSTLETKYRYRKGERSCPKCGQIGTVRKSNREPAGWYCWKKIDGCGATFPLSDPQITQQVVGNVENPDPLDLFNTVLKMGQKRAYVDGILRTTGTSALYTQDVEDLPAHYLGNAGPADPPEGGEAAAPHTAAATRQKAEKATRAAEQSPTYAGAATASDKCPECHAPGNKPHTRQCSRRGGQDLQLQQPAAAPSQGRRPTSPDARSPAEERLAAHNRMMGLYKDWALLAHVDPESREDRLSNLSQILQREVPSVQELSLDELRRAADWLSGDIQAIRDSEAASEGAYVDGPYEDPFQDE